MPDPGDRTKAIATAAGVTAIGGLAAVAVAVADRAGGRRGRSVAAAPKKETGAAPDGSSAAAAKEQDATAPDADASFKPEGPEDLHEQTWVYALRKTAKEFSADQCTDLAAALVYYSVLALGPGIIAIVSILGLLSPSTVGDVKTQFLPPVQQSSPAVYDLIVQLLDNATSTPGVGIGLVVGILGALWSASGYVGAFSRAMNRIYSVPEGRPIWKLRPTQLLVTLAVVVLVVLGALLLVSTGPVVERIADVIGVGPIAFTVFQIVKWPILVVIAIAAIAILYYFSSNVRQPKFKWISTGSILALVVWALATAGLGLYLTLSGGGSYGKTYGAIAGVVVFLLWLWITNLVLLFGAEFDAELERGRELQAGIEAEEQIQLPLRDTRQSDKKAKAHEKDVAAAKALRESAGREAR